MTNADPEGRTPAAALSAGPGVDGLMVLDERECRNLLAASHVGRIAVSERSLPVILPVNFVLDGDSIVLCTAPGSTLARAANGTVACLEIDDHDPVEHTGWSVLVTGRLAEITDPADRRDAARLPIVPWRHIDDLRHLRLSMDLVSGRRLSRN